MRPAARLRHAAPARIVQRPRGVGLGEKAEGEGGRCFHRSKVGATAALARCSTGGGLVAAAVDGSRPRRLIQSLR
eukprot:scaffold3464_cov406-Prasinococcus_capsulatus_cf.AAC.17